MQTKVAMPGQCQQYRRGNVADPHLQHSTVWHLGGNPVVNFRQGGLRHLDRGCSA